MGFVGESRRALIQRRGNDDMKSVAVAIAVDVISAREEEHIIGDTEPTMTREDAARRDYQSRL